MRKHLSLLLEKLKTNDMHTYLHYCKPFKYTFLSFNGPAG